MEILCTNYGRIGGFWFDGNWTRLDADWKEDALYATIRKYQPEAMIINNTGADQRGRTGHPEIDSVTFEQGRPTPMNREGMEKYLAAEMCQTVNDHWGYGKSDLNYKSPKELIENLCLCRKVGANYLLNIGPEAQGKVNLYQEQLLSLIGRWMNLYGEAIYYGRPYSARGTGKNFVLKSEDGKSLYFFVFDPFFLMDPGELYNPNMTVIGRDTGIFAFANMQDEISELHWMDNGEPLRFAQGDRMLSVDMTGMSYGFSCCVRVAKAAIWK